MQVSSPLTYMKVMNTFKKLVDLGWQYFPKKIIDTLTKNREDTKSPVLTNVQMKDSDKELKSIF